MYPPKKISRPQLDNNGYISCLPNSTKLFANLKSNYGITITLRSSNFNLMAKLSVGLLKDQ